MFNLAEIYWDWLKARKARKPLMTEQGHKVRQFGEKYAVCSTFGYKDLVTSGHTWTQASGFFRDCLKDREWIEKNYGKIIDKKD